MEAKRTTPSYGPWTSRGPCTKWTKKEVLEKFGVTAKVEHFLSCTKPSVHISIRFTDDGMFLKKVDGSIELHAYTHPLLSPQEDEHLAAVLLHRGIPPQTDYLADMGRTRILHSQLRLSPHVISEICAEILIRAYGIAGSDELLFE